MRSLALTLVVTLATGCATGSANDPRAEAVFASIENALLSARVLRVDYEISAEGAIGARLDGDLVAQHPHRAALRADGVFAGADMELRLAANGEQMRGSSGAAGFTAVQPPALIEALVVGWLRMGVLHNLALLSGGAPPDRADGTVRDWVVPHSFAFVDGPRAGARAISFALDVSGSPAGEVVLHYDPATNFPTRREQVVHFDTGDMRVTEDYRVETDGMIGPCRFAIDMVTEH